MYTLDFSGEKAKDRYEISTQSILISQRQTQVAEWEDAVSLIRKLKSIGVPSNKVGDTQLYDLQEGGGTIILENTEKALLESFIQQPIWRALILEQVLEVKNWLAGLAKKDLAVHKD